MSKEECEMNFRDYEQKCEEIQRKNEIYLEEFEEDLLNAGLKGKTINRHVKNIDFYINIYLLRLEPLEMISGTDPFYIDDFLGNFLIHKAMWSTPSAIKSTAASMKKFYKSMLERENIGKLDYKKLRQTIKDDMNFWLEYCEIYINPDSWDPFDLV